MSEKLSSRDLAVLFIIARTRGARAKTIARHPLFKTESADAVRKRLERLCDQGFLVASKLPRGPQIFRLSQKGVALTGAPAAYANSPSAGIAADMIAVSELCLQEECLFPTRAELEELFAEIASDSERPRLAGRFVLRLVNTAGGDRSGASSELHLHAFLAELRTADDLARRAGVVIDSLRRSPVFRDLIQANLLGLTICAPSRGVKASLEARIFPVETSVVVVEELQDLIAH
jgi:hypothetical protein